MARRTEAATKQQSRAGSSFTEALRRASNQTRSPLRNIGIPGIPGIGVGAVAPALGAYVGGQTAFPAASPATAPQAAVNTTGVIPPVSTAPASISLPSSLGGTPILAEVLDDGGGGGGGDDGGGFTSPDRERDGYLDALLDFGMWMGRDTPGRTRSIPDPGGLGSTLMGGAAGFGGGFVRDPIYNSRGDVVGYQTRRDHGQIGEAVNAQIADQLQANADAYGDIRDLNARMQMNEQNLRAQMFNNLVNAQGGLGQQYYNAMGNVGSSAYGALGSMGSNAYRAYGDALAAAYPAYYGMLANNQRTNAIRDIFGQMAPMFGGMFGGAGGSALGAAAGGIPGIPSNPITATTLNRPAIQQAAANVRDPVGGQGPYGMFARRYGQTPASNLDRMLTKQAGNLGLGIQRAQANYGLGLQDVLQGSQHSAQRDALRYYAQLMGML